MTRMSLKRKIHNLLNPKIGEVWMLHRVVEQRSEQPDQRVLEVTPDWLEERIVERQRQGWHFVSLDNIRDSRHWICITLDDGYRDNYTLGYPLFKRMGIPFTVYVTTGFIDNQLPMWWYPGKQLGICTDELRKMDTDPLCTIGAHTVGHPKLDTLIYDQQYKEIAESRQALETLLGHEVSHFSFPHGAYNADTLDICHRLGFRTAVTTNGRTVRTDYAPLELDRLNIVQPD